MAFFGRRKQEEHENMPVELPSLSSLDQQFPLESPAPPPPQPIKKEPEKPAIAPLFVKIDRYRQILGTIGNLKTALVIVKNSLGTLHQIEKTRDATFEIVSDIVNKMDEKLVNLDNELLRPAGFHETSESSPEKQDIRSIEATVADLQGQIEQLKSELGKMI